MGIHVPVREKTRIALLTAVIGDSISVSWQRMNGVLNQVRQEERMGLSENEELAASNSGTGDLLYVTDLVSDNEGALEFASELAEKRSDQLELLYVIDREKASSRPDAQMGIQYALEALARSLKHLKRSTRVRLLFGRPEDVISKRAIRRCGRR